MAKNRKGRRREGVPSVPRAAKLQIKVKKKQAKAGFPVTTTHKPRSEWFRNNVAWPFREASVHQLVKERRRVQRALEKQSAASDWELVGPTNIGGRMTCVVAHPTNADILWAGAAGGGVWQSTDAGQTWKALWSQQESLNIGALAIDPKSSDTLYCGTGEANLSADSYPGVGLYKSVDGGKSWELLAPSAAGLPPRIGAIAVDPFDANHLFVGGVSHNYPGETQLPGRAGLYESTDGGKNWRRLDFVSPAEYRCHAVLFHPKRANIVYATITEQGSDNGIWRSTDGGKTWRHLTQGLPPSDQFNRTSLAISLSQPSVLYAQAADANGRVLGVFRTDDGGNSWTSAPSQYFHYTRKIGNIASEYEVQMTYNNAIAVHPTNSDHVLCGGVDLHLSEDGGKTWRLVTRWEQDRGKPDYAHADHHAILMPAAKPGRVYDMNDGGMDVSEDGGQTWTNRSNGLAATMFYDIDVAQSNANYFGGGCQDNGSVITTTGKPDDFFDVTGGDGGFLIFDPRDENHIYASIYNLGIFRYPSAGNQWEDVSPPATDNEKKAVWMAYVAMDPSNSKVVYTGSSRVWQTKNDGKSWDAISPFFDGVISAIEVAVADPSRIYVGTEAGSLYRSLDGGKTWSGDLSSADVPNFKITRVQSKPTNADHVIATVGNFNVSHVFRSLDGCKTWTDVDRGRLPDVPHNSIAIPAHQPNEVYVANDAGVFVSPDFGDTWRNLTGKLPKVNVIDIVYHDATSTLSAATYGRSIWRIRIR